MFCCDGMIFNPVKIQVTNTKKSYELLHSLFKSSHTWFMVCVAQPVHHSCLIWM